MKKSEIESQRDVVIKRIEFKLNLRFFFFFEQVSLVYGIFALIRHDFVSGPNQECRNK